MKPQTKFKQTEIGTIPEDWKVKTVDQIKSPAKSALAMGPFGSNIKKECFVKEGVPIIRGNNLTSYRFLDEDFVYLTEEKADDLKSSNCLPGDLVITHRGTLGQVGLIPKKSRYERYIISQSGMKLSCDGTQVISEYVFYFLKSPVGQHMLLRNTSQTGVPAIAQPLTSLKNIPLPVPDIEEQKRITKVFEDFNDKIDLLQKQNKTLEAMGQAIFKHWFIDFEFPTEEGKPYKSSGGEMFYNEELGKEIPKGWKVEHFSKIIEVNPKRELSKGKLAKKVSMADLNPWQSWIENWSLEEYKSGPKFKNGDTLFARITPSLENGKTAFVYMLDNNEVGFGSTEFIIFSTKIISSGFYIFHLCRSEEIRNASISAMTGTSGRQRVPDDLFDYLPIILPPIIILDEFEKINSSLFNQISNNAKEIKITSEIRDSLLPKLMSGKIRVHVKVN